MSFTFNQINFPKYDRWGRMGIQSRLSIWALEAQQSRNLNNDEGYSWESLIQLLKSDNERKKNFIITSWSKILYGNPGAASKEKLLDIFTEWAKQKKINDDEFYKQVEEERRKERKRRERARAAAAPAAAAPSAAGPTFKGACFFCGKDVLSNQKRLKTRNGEYAHTECATQNPTNIKGSLQKTRKGGGKRRKTKKRRRKRKTKRKKRKTKKRRRKRKRKTKKKRRR